MSEPTQTGPLEVGSPPTDPAWNPQPAEQAGSAVVQSTSGAVVAAGVILLAIATLIGIVATFAIFAGAMMDQWQSLVGGGQSGLTDEEVRAAMSMGRTFVIVIGAVLLVIAVAHLASGIGVLRRRGWARIVGLVMAALGLLVWALALLGNVVAATQTIPAGYLTESGLTVEQYRALVGVTWIFGVAISGVALAAYLFILVVLIRRGREFA
jgi:hypothetical protein